MAAAKQTTKYKTKLPSGEELSFSLTDAELKTYENYAEDAEKFWDAVAVVRSALDFSLALQITNMREEKLLEEMSKDRFPLEKSLFDITHPVATIIVKEGLDKFKV